MTATAIRAGRRTRRRRVLGVDVDVLWLLVPAVLPILALSVYPLLRGIWIGFTDAQAGPRDPAFNGVDNYVRALEDPYFWESFRTGFVWAAAVTALTFAASLGLALLLDKRLPGRGALRMIAILPWAVPPVVVAFMWTLVYHPHAGLLNDTLRDLGLLDANVNWLHSGFALVAVIIAAVWAAMPVTTVVILAALQNVPRELVEAAAMDRAGPLATFRVVTWPAILPSVVAITTLDFIANFNAFGLVYVMTSGAPSGALRLPMLLAYEEAFNYGNFGYAAALGNVMVLAVAILLVVYLRIALRKRWAA
jgi:multiple sugar transport system permease protein